MPIDNEMDRWEQAHAAVRDVTTAVAEIEAVDTEVGDADEVTAEQNQRGTSAMELLARGLATLDWMFLRSHTCKHCTLKELLGRDDLSDGLRAEVEGALTIYAEAQALSEQVDNTLARAHDELGDEAFA